HGFEQIANVYDPIQDLATIPDTLHATVSGNDLSNNGATFNTASIGFGLRCLFYPLNIYAVSGNSAFSAKLEVIVRGNLFNKNKQYGVLVDAGFLKNTKGQHYNARFRGDFLDNKLQGNA